ncbi:hypothetical protein CRENBAI_012182 [Crenichthys baileyi]|uniref:DUF6729 domain-containing protein n=1 Tax=Crenichthys baileyi TaxID=28760 RepID=A0AAV9SD39_9TELE
MSRCLLYLETCKTFQAAGVHPSPTAHPPRMQPVPTSGWLLSTYARENFSRMEELQASVTSVFGSILKMDSTKKVIKKLAGADEQRGERAGAGSDLRRDSAGGIWAARHGQGPAEALRAGPPQPP